jgi:hypothetical protein
MSCRDGRCACAPRCDATRCAADDGCGGRCGPCALDLSCADCTLRLGLIERVPGAPYDVITLALDYVPPPGVEAPRIADLRIRAEGPVTIERVGLGRDVVDAGKQLFVDPRTGSAWSELPGGVHRFLVYSTASTTPIPAGRWLFIRYHLDDRGAAPAVFTLQRNDQVLAPPGANEPLASQPIDTPVVVWPEGDDAQP